jgi:hypothetical protein
MKHLKLFESFEIVEPIKYGEPLNNKEINFLKEYNIMCPEWILKDDNYYYIHDHRCENIKDLPATYINDVCKKFNIKNYTINDDYSIDVKGDVDLGNKGFIKLPLKFNIVSGYFDCRVNKLTTLEGCPKKIGGNFLCSYNRLTTLEGCPKKIGGDFRCSHNQLTILKGSPKSVLGNFHCDHNKLTTLEGSPKSVGGGFDCSHNRLTTLEGGPTSVGGYFLCVYNMLTTLEGVPESIGEYLDCSGNPLEYKGIIKGELIYK